MRNRRRIQRRGPLIVYHQDQVCRNLKKKKKIIIIYYLSNIYHFFFILYLGNS